MKFANLSLNIHMHLDFYSHFLLRVSEFWIPESGRTGSSYNRCTAVVNVLSSGPALPTTTYRGEPSIDVASVPAYPSFS